MRLIQLIGIIAVKTVNESGLRVSPTWMEYFVSRHECQVECSLAERESQFIII